MSSNHQKIILVTGKGGVGKTVVAAAIAKKLTSLDSSVLLAELGDQSSYQYLFDLMPGQEPQPSGLGFDLTRWSGASCLREYVGHLLPSEAIIRLFFDNSVMKALIQAAPALEELALMGKITSGHRKIGPELNYDFIVVDCYSTGHFKALLEAPGGMAEAVAIGPMGEQSRSIDKVIRDSEKTKVIVVCLPEDLPTQESLELTQYLRSKKLGSAKVLLNKVWPIPLELQDLEQLRLQMSGEASEFINYLVDEKKSTLLSQSELKSEKPMELPMIFKSSSIDLIKSLAERINIQWLNS